MNLTVLKKIVLSALIVAIASSCGGGGTSGGENIVTVSPTPTPTPTPPPPSPSPSYPTAFDFSIDRSFSFPMAMAYYVERYTSDVPPYYSLESWGGELYKWSFLQSKLIYSQASETFSISHDGVTTAFGPSELTRKEEGLRWFFKQLAEPAKYDSLDLYTFAPNLKFVAFGTQDTRSSARGTGQAAGTLSTTRYFLFGAPTVVSDIPKSGDFTYRVGGQTSSPYGLDGGVKFSIRSGNIQISQGMTRVTGTLDIEQLGSVNGSAQQKGQITIFGTINPDSNEISGSISGTTVQLTLTGEFAGQLYGPQGSELGLVLVLRRNDFLRGGMALPPIVGVLAGAR